MADHKVYVWRLVVDIPEGVGWRNPPQAWLDYQADIEADGPTHPDDDDGPYFSWPQRRNFLTRGPAEQMAARLRSYGATVTVERSDPVCWPDRATRTTDA